MAKSAPRRRSLGVVQFHETVTIDAPADVVWAVYTDVERWPEWTRSVRSCTYVRGSAIVVGAQVRIVQPKLLPATWEVTAVEPGRSWTWDARSPGVRTSATHVLEAPDARTTRALLTITQQGALSAVIGRAYGRLTRSYLAMEAAGLQRQSEARHGAA